MFTKNIPEKQRVQLKGGAVVDADSDLENRAHVYQRGETIFSCVLGAVDIIKNINSYYKLQVLESDKKHSWWLFRSWGRVGTTIGSDKLESMENLTDAITRFESLYEGKTGNRFDKRKFRKVADRMYPLDIDYGQDDEKMCELLAKGSKSKLAKPIQELISILFDIDTMKSALVEFEIDLKKMPLGKLSRKQMEKAYLVLTEALGLLKEGGDSSGPMLLDCSNRFYTLIPHDFGMKKPPILDDEEFIKTKIEMLDSLSEIEIAYNLLKSEDGEDKNADPIDIHYKKLKTKMDVLQKDTDEFSMLKDYVKNTHASTHNMYSLELEDVFKVERQGENERFKPFKQLPNRQLLWHGSRLRNCGNLVADLFRTSIKRRHLGVATAETSPGSSITTYLRRPPHRKEFVIKRE